MKKVCLTLVFGAFGLLGAGMVLTGTARRRPRRA